MEIKSNFRIENEYKPLSSMMRGGGGMALHFSALNGTSSCCAVENSSIRTFQPQMLNYNTKQYACMIANLFIT